MKMNVLFLLPFRLSSISSGRLDIGYVFTKIWINRFQNK